MEGVEQKGSFFVEAAKHCCGAIGSWHSLDSRGQIMWRGIHHYVIPLWVGQERIQCQRWEGALGVVRRKLEMPHIVRILGGVILGVRKNRLGPQPRGRGPGTEFCTQ